MLLVLCLRTRNPSSLVSFPLRLPKSRKFAVCFRTLNFCLWITVSMSVIYKIYILSLTSALSPGIHWMADYLQSSQCLPCGAVFVLIWQRTSLIRLLLPIFSPLTSHLLGPSLWKGKTSCSPCHSPQTLTVMDASCSFNSSYFFSSHQPGTPQKLNTLRHFFTQYFSS